MGEPRRRVLPSQLEASLSRAVEMESFASALLEPWVLYVHQCRSPRGAGGLYSSRFRGLPLAPYPAKRAQERRGCVNKAGKQHLASSGRRTEGPQDGDKAAEGVQQSALAAGPSTARWAASQIRRLQSGTKTPRGWLYQRPPAPPRARGRPPSHCALTCQPLCVASVFISFSTDHQSG